ncbi:MAG: hypothetical protein R2852_06070 [Bacteroidia bacterium]
MRFLPLVFIIFSIQVHAQGLYQDYGQNSTQTNKVAYSLKSNQIEILYYKDGESLAKKTLEKVQSYIPEYENRLNYNLSNGIRIIVFNNYDAYKKSNINITNPQYYAGGYSTLNENAATVYFNGSHVNFEIQIRKAVAEVLINEFIFGGNIKDRIQTSALLTLPDWYYKGLVAYLAESWNIENDNFLKDFFQSKKQKYFTSLQEEDEILAGHSIWRYLEEKNGRGAVSNIVFLTRIGRSVENAVVYYTGLNINSLLNDWQEFYLEKYKNDELVFKNPKGEENAPKKLAKKRHTQFKLNSDGSKIAIVTNNLGRYQIVLYDIKSKTVNIIDRGGHQLLNRDQDLNYPLIAWNPSDKVLSVVTYQNEITLLKRFDLNGKLLDSKQLSDIPFVKGFNYSPNGDKIVFSVIRSGQSDLIIYDIKTSTSKLLSDDIYDNLSPRFSTDGNSIFFVSNQYFLENRSSSFYAIFKTNLASNTTEYVVGYQNEKINCTEPIQLNDSLISYLSDKNGIVNNFFFDTHLKRNYQLTNYKRCIIHNDLASDASVVADLLYFNNRYRIYVSGLSQDYQTEAIANAESTLYRKWLNHEIDSITTFIKTKPDTSSLSDTIQIDTVPKRVFISGFSESETLEIKGQDSKQNNDPYITVAKTQFGIDYFLQLFDKSILNDYLFPAGVNEKIFNYPLLSPHFQTKISDIQKNHVIVAGLRIPFRIKAADYYFQYNYLKGRWDKEISGFRRSRVLEDYILPSKMINSKVKFSLHYPFNERSRISFGFFGRDDRVVIQARDSLELVQDIKQSLYFGNSVEYVFDNVRSNGLNLFQGLRFKIYSENYNRSNGGYQFISNNGIDLRWYKKLHRQIYFATRISGAISFGSQSTAYYLGGVENSFVNVDTNKNFNYEIPTLRGSEYAFQTIITPTRGFLRNSRAGNKYMLMNMELRVPLFAYLIQKPITSEFFRSIMLIGFVDIGTAWRGKSPYSIENPFNTKIINSPLYNISVVTQRDPFLYAFGVGARAKVLGHYIKWDHGWGIIENKFQKGISTFSIGLDF